MASPLYWTRADIRRGKLVGYEVRTHGRRLAYYSAVKLGAGPALAAAQQNRDDRNKGPLSGEIIPPI